MTEAEGTGSKMAIIQCDSLSKVFVSNAKKPGLFGLVRSLFSNENMEKLAIDRLSFEIEPGEIVGYIGANGAGKSTTIKIMTGILTPSAGSCVVNGIIPYERRMENAKQIGVVFGQRTQLWWDLPLIESFAVLKTIYEVSDSDYEQRMRELDEILGISEFMHQTVRTLSLGQRMRADLAAALIHNPPILYLDEPTIGLDVMVKDRIREAIRRMNRQFNTTVILTTHDMSDIEELCNHIIVIDNGRKIFDGTPEELKNRYRYLSRIIVQIDPKGKAPEEIIDNINAELDVDSVKETAGGLAIEFDKSVTPAKKIIDYVFEKYDATEFSVNNVDLGMIVRDIYKDGIHDES